MVKPNNSGRIFNPSRYVLFLLCALFFIPSAQADDEGDLTEMSLEDLMNVQVEPSSVSAITSHIHNKGDWMVGYHFMPMSMETNRDGTSDLSDAQVLSDFFITPTNMEMDMHMFMLMYAPTDDLTLMAMANWNDKRMRHISRTGVKFTTDTEGWGDTTLLANYVFYRTPTDSHIWSVNGGVSLPTGSIDERGLTPLGFVVLPYPMQLGSGTYDVKIGGNYQYFTDRWSTGIGAMGTIRIGENDADYTLGDMIEVDTFLTYEWVNWLSTSARVKGMSWGNIDGADKRIATTNPKGVPLVPTAFTDKRGGTRIDLEFDVELFVPQGKFQGNRFGISFALPIYENLQGPQLSTDWIARLGWQWIF